MKKMSKMLLAFLTVFTIMFTNASFIGTDGNAYAACSVTAGVPDAACNKEGADLNKKIYTFGATISGVVVGIALLMIIYGGFKYVTSQGDPKATESAKSQIMFAGIGMLIVMCAFVIMKLIIGGSGAGTGVVN